MSEEHPTLEERVISLQVEMAEARKDHKHLDDCVDGLKEVVNDRLDKTSAKIDRIYDKLDNRIDKLGGRQILANAAVAGLVAAATAAGIDVVGRGG